METKHNDNIINRKFNILLGITLVSLIFGALGLVSFIRSFNKENFQTSSKNFCMPCAVNPNGTSTYIDSDGKSVPCETIEDWLKSPQGGGKLGISFVGDTMTVTQSQKLLNYNGDSSDESNYVNSENLICGISKISSIDKSTFPVTIKFSSTTQGTTTQGTTTTQLPDFFINCINAVDKNKFDVKFSYDGSKYTTNPYLNWADSIGFCGATSGCSGSGIINKIEGSIVSFSKPYTIDISPNYANDCYAGSQWNILTDLGENEGNSPDDKVVPECGVTSIPRNTSLTGYISIVPK
jgi:hypothetical protein